jgi:ParB-like chromosome segregation protein Spo0J
MASSTSNRLVRLVPLDTLRPLARNVRLHSDEQLETIKGSIREFGFTNPVLADATGIVAGHGRILAVQALQDEGFIVTFPDGTEIPSGTIPVIDCTGWSDAQRRAYAIADNRIALSSTWDRELLARELADLAGEFDSSLLGFSEDDMRRLSDQLNLATLDAIAKGAVTVEQEDEDGSSDEGDDEDDEDNDEGDDGAEYFSFSVSMLWDDREEVNAAIRAAKDQIRTDSTPNALLHICRQFLK